MLQTKYITLDEFTQYFPNEDLIASMGSQEGAIAFLKRIEDRMEAYVGANFDKNVERLYGEFTDYQKEHYKLALLEQCIYVLKNGEISVDSGYDPERGEIVNITTLKKLALSFNSKEQLILCGLWSRHIRAGRYCFWDWLVR